MMQLAILHISSRTGHEVEPILIFKCRLKVLSERDALKVAREEAMNALEAYIYDKQDKAYQVAL